MSVRQEYRQAQEIARRITEEVGEPFFYSEQKKAVEHPAVSSKNTCS